jgi:hypothetical protein
VRWVGTLAFRLRQFKHLSVPRAPNRLFPGEPLLGLLSTKPTGRANTQGTSKEKAHVDDDVVVDGKRRSEPVHASYVPFLFRDVRISV